MAIDEAHQRVVQDWMAAKHVRPCGACGENSWNVAGIITETAIVPDDPDPAHGRLSPMLQVVCTHCAMVRLFAADTIGIA